MSRSSAHLVTTWQCPNTGFLLLDPHLLSSILLSLLCGGHSAPDTELPVWGWVPFSCG